MDKIGGLAHQRDPIPAKAMRARAFTLIELLVAMSILALVLVLMLQVVNGILQSTRTQSQQLDAVAGARRALDVMALDLRNAMINESASVLVPTVVTNTLFAMLTPRRGPEGTANHRFLAVRYRLETNAIVREFRSVPFSENGFLAAAASGTFTTNARPLATGVLAISARSIGDGANMFPLNPAVPGANWATVNYNATNRTTPADYAALITYSPAFAAGLPNRTRAVEIWIAAVDGQNAALLASGTLQSAVQTAIAAAASPAQWREKIDATANIPPQIKSGIRILNKTVPLP